MNETRDPAHFSQQIVLRNGTPALIRAIRPDDTARIDAAFHKLNPQSVYTRFFSHKRELTPQELQRIGATDFVHSVVLSVSIGSGADEIFIGGASYHVLAAEGGARAAEVAFTIEEDYQGQGLASRLFAALADIARGQGIARFEADVLAGNSPMLAVFERTGLPMKKKSDHGIVHLVLDLTQAAGSGVA